MKVEKPIKNYQVLKELRQLRDRMSAELEGLSPEEVVAYFRNQAAQEEAERPAYVEQPRE